MPEPANERVAASKIENNWRPANQQLVSKTMVDNDSGKAVASQQEIQQLLTFSRLLSTDKEAAERVKTCPNPEAIVDVAAQLGLTISVAVLREHIWELQADHWPWAREGGRWRVRFFHQADA